MSILRQNAVVAALGTTQTLSWASSNYLLSLLAAPLEAGVGMPVTRVFSAFTLALVIPALVGPAAGRAIDRHGGCTVLRITNSLFVAGLAGPGLAQDKCQVWTAWAIVSVPMSSGLCDGAFAVLPAELAQRHH